MEAKKPLPGSKHSLTTGKIKDFKTGRHTVSRFQRDKEAAAEKQRQREKEVSSIFESFVASFEGESTDSKTFLQGGGGAAYTLGAGAGSKRGAAAPGKPMSEMEKMMQEMKARGGNKAPVRAGQGPKAMGHTGPRQIDSFMQELKGRKEFGLDRFEETAASKGSMDDGDPTSTNLYLGHLSPVTTEETLEELFSKFGEIYSIKIMWPRTDEERQRKRNCGFVSFYRREDAVAARNALNDVMVDDYAMSIGWGKPVSKLARRVEENTKVSGPGAAAPPPDVPNPDAAESIKVKVGNVVIPIAATPQAPTPALNVIPAQEMAPNDPRVDVVLPQDPEQRALIDRTARYVVKDGMPFENQLKDRELSNPKFAFLRDGSSPEGLYYRWRVYAMLMGDKDRKWRSKPFRMVPGGHFWVPPDVPQEIEEEREEEREREKEKRSNWESRRERDRTVQNERHKYATGRQLEKAREGELDGRRMVSKDRERFQAILAGLTTSRKSIKQAMGFALDNSENSKEVVALLAEAMLSAKSAAEKVAYLHLASDVLHNSTAPVRNASSYRSLLEGRLPELFENLGNTFRAIEGRMSARQVEDRVLAVMEAWEQWSLYPALYMTGLEATFKRKRDEFEHPKEEKAGVDLDMEALVKKAQQAGLFTEGLSATDVLARLEHLSRYARAKAAKQSGGAKAGVVEVAGALTGLGQGWSNTVVDYASSDGSSDDVDGVPLDSGEVEVDPDGVDGVPLTGWEEVAPQPPQQGQGKRRSHQEVTPSAELPAKKPKH
ncbi:unnamed protein product [Chrysoparadoxa australica]